MKKIIIALFILLLPTYICFSQDGNITSKEYQEVEKKLQGLWGTIHYPQDLLFFEGENVTRYDSVWADDGNPMPGPHYTKWETKSYKIEKLMPSEGIGYRIILDYGSTYWLLEDEPNVLYCFWYKNGELMHSMSDSYAGTDVTVDELILH